MGGDRPAFRPIRRAEAAKQKATIPCQAGCDLIIVFQNVESQIPFYKSGGRSPPCQAFGSEHRNKMAKRNGA